MDLNTAVAIFLEQTASMMNRSMEIQQLAIKCSELINQENSISDVIQQIHALTGTGNVTMESIGAQLSLLQSSLDKVAELSA